MDRIWEDAISLNASAELSDAILGKPREYVELNDGSVVCNGSILPVDGALARDDSVLPTLEHREGYYGENHFNYWLSGLRDYEQLEGWLRANGVEASALLDFGCASGRFARHAYYAGLLSSVYACDINRLHVDWIARNLPRGILAFQNTSVPLLPIPDGCLDVVTAFSVFTHLESFDTSWIMEFRRILRPGGIAWLTIHGERTWREMNDTWPLYSGLEHNPAYAPYLDVEHTELPADRLLFRWKPDRSYSANVFYRTDYLRKTWGRLLTVRDIFPALPPYQDVIVLQKN
ncbi:MAG TPA: class I SAM-dependent methyltransferase [Candidatus Acidoferrales bacterium]|jgi:SAM-dependent methyltransferase|nr:class I SAM-dependent methyltransferase [Candidatus Acidoferrales bacterium]